ncbi:hypothetical protein L1O03_03420 [Corynebacterium uropygiale]|uniref:Uncharacterized protein n=1 Tax=Corynebacterium uropygiale TaxID=1775911 RepID=A0A9X1QPU3_9CORY|nr:hypothetical protein [Corynebacterium uropygiale]MCF4006227.1 hypothetical protein [Corynebacterium uropygiale]
MTERLRTSMESSLRTPPVALKRRALARASSTVDFPVPFSPVRMVTAPSMCQGSTMSCRITGSRSA